MKAKRQPKRIVNPLLLVAGMQPLGHASAMAFLSEFDTFLFAVERGRGTGGSIRGITLFMSAMYDAARHYQARNLEALIDASADFWLRAAERCSAHGLNDRLVVNAEELAALNQLHAAMRVFLPEVQVGPWKAFIEHAAERWDRFARQSNAFSPYAEASE